MNLFVKIAFIHGIYQTDLNRHLRLRIPGGQGVHVGQDEVAGAVAAEGGFVLAPGPALQALAMAA